MSDIRIRGPLADCDAESVLRSAWADYGGNNMDTEFWQVFSEAANYTLKMAAACLGQSPDPDIAGLELTEQICFDKVKKERDAHREALRVIRILSRDDDTLAMEIAISLAEKALSQPTEGK